MRSKTCLTGIILFISLTINISAIAQQDVDRLTAAFQSLVEGVQSNSMGTEAAYENSHIDTKNITKETLDKWTNQTLAPHGIEYSAMQQRANNEMATIRESAASKNIDKSLLEGVLPCKDNVNCKGASIENSDDFDAAIALQATSQVAHDISAHKLKKIFQGEPLTCHADGFGYNNCCKDKGWGQSIGLAHCSKEEKRLGKAKEEGRVVYLGKKTKRDLSGKKKTKKRYCVFETKLAYLVQTQARPKHIPRHFGSYKHFDCFGLSLNEFKQLPLESFNFQAAFGDNRLYQTDFKQSTSAALEQQAIGRLHNGNPA